MATTTVTEKVVKQREINLVLSEQEATILLYILRKVGGVCTTRNTVDNIGNSLNEYVKWIYDESITDVGNRSIYFNDKADKLFSQIVPVPATFNACGEIK